MQQLCYFQRIKREICLTKAFTYNLRDYIQTSIQQGFEIILSIDANEIMQCGRTATLLKSIGLIETTSLFTSKTPPNTFTTRRFKIDAAWTTPNLAPSSSIIAPFSFGVGYHRVFIVDFQVESILGDEIIPMAKPDTRRLISSQKQSVLNYHSKGEEILTIM